MIFRALSGNPLLTYLTLCIRFERAILLGRPHDPHSRSHSLAVAVRAHAKHAAGKIPTHAHCHAHCLPTYLPMLPLRGFDLDGMREERRH